MKRNGSVAFMIALMFLLTIFHPNLLGSETGLPAPGNNKVAYYVFDSGGPDHFPLPTFTDAANIVVVFEGTLWELADSLHYSTGWMRNVNYHSYAEILRDIRILQARGVKVLMNVDDAPSWSTSTPFTTYDGKKLNAQEFAAFIGVCAIDSVHLDGISLDIEHGATGNAAYIALIKEIGKYFGPLSSNNTSQIYTAAIYSGGAPGPVIGKSRDIAAYMNFIMDMAYFTWDYVARINQWADSIGASKTMVGVLNDFYDLAHATSAAAWQPASPPKAGIMVYAANNLKSYTDAVFNALVVAPGIAAAPSPADNATGISTTPVLSWRPDPAATLHEVYFGNSNPPESKGDQADTIFAPGLLAENTTYYWRINEKNSAGATVGPVWSFTTGMSSSIRAEADGVPGEFALLQNYPNPFNPSTTIKYKLPGSSDVRLSVSDMLGREVSVLVNERREAGVHEVKFDASSLSSGMYLYRLQAGEYVQTRKCILMR
jgi:Secretion system C-terminal sorting domain